MTQHRYTKEILLRVHPISKIIFGLFILMVPCFVFAGTAHYVDCSAGSGGNGTYASPWNNIPSVNSNVFSTGDDVYFKVSTTCTLTADADRLQIDWNGTATDRVIIGCYDGENDFDCGASPYTDGSRPIIDGNESYPAIDYNAIVRTDGYDYITIQELKVVNSWSVTVPSEKPDGAHGISIQNSDYPIVDNCYVSHTGRIGISLYRTNYGTVSESYVTDAYYLGNTGDCIDISAGGLAGSSTHNTVKKNVVHNCNEGIGVYVKAENTTVEYNSVYDLNLVGIYVDASKDTTIRYNLVYQPSASAGGAKGIALDNEAARGYCYTGATEVYGNLVAALQRGIQISNQYGDEEDTSCNWNDVLVYNNTIVDNATNTRIIDDDAGWTGNEIKNNISFLETAATVHNVDDSPTGFTWSKNIFYGIDTVGGDAAATQVSGDPKLAKTTGWRALSAGAITGGGFNITTGSVAIDAAVLISQHNRRFLSATDFTASPISASVGESNDPDVGAYEFDEEEIVGKTKLFGVSGNRITIEKLIYPPD